MFTLLWIIVPIGIFGCCFGITRIIGFENIRGVHDAFDHVQFNNTVAPFFDRVLSRRIVQWLETAKFFCTNIWLKIEQKMTKSCTKINNNKYCVQFIIEGKLYKIFVKPIRGPPLSFVIRDDLNNDITNTFESYIRGLKCVRNRITPLDMGYNKIVYDYTDSIVLSIEKDEIIDSASLESNL